MAERAQGINVFAAGLGHCRCQLTVGQANEGYGKAAYGEGDQGAQGARVGEPDASHQHPAPADHGAETQGDDFS